MPAKPAHQEQHKTHTPNGTPRHTVPGRGPGAITGRRFKWCTKHTELEAETLSWQRKLITMFVMLIISDWSFRFVLPATSKKVWLVHWYQCFVYSSAGQLLSKKDKAMFWRAYCPSRDKNRGEKGRKYWSWSGINTHLRSFVLVCNTEFRIGHRQIRKRKAIYQPKGRNAINSLLAIHCHLEKKTSLGLFFQNVTVIVYHAAKRFNLISLLFPLQKKQTKKKQSGRWIIWFSVFTGKAGFHGVSTLYLERCD